MKKSIYQSMLDSSNWKDEKIKNLELQLEKCRDMAMVLGMECNEKQQKLEKAKKALEFYADDNSWCSGSTNHRSDDFVDANCVVINDTRDFQNDNKNCWLTGGSIAKRTLEELK